MEFHYFSSLLNTMIIKTPILKSKTLSNINNCNIWLKMESTQPFGSFKQRSIGNACSYYAEQSDKKFISSSGGNAGISVAYMGNSLNIPATIVVPKIKINIANKVNNILFKISLFLG